MVLQCDAAGEKEAPRKHYRPPTPGGPPRYTDHPLGALEPVRGGVVRLAGPLVGAIRSGNCSHHVLAVTFLLVVAARCLLSPHSSLPRPAMLGGFNLGVAMGWTSSAFYINKAFKEDKDIAEHESYIGGLMPIGAILVMLILSFILDSIGRKLTMLGVAPLCAVSFLIPGLYKNYICWMVMRVLMGFSCGAFCVAAPIYVAEIAQKEIRGTLGAMFQLLLTVGVLYAYALGLTRNLLAFSHMAALAPCVFFVCFIYFPETPIFLLDQGKEEAAIKSLQWYRGKDYNITTEFLKTKAKYEAMKSKSFSPKDLVETKAARKSLIIVLGLMLIQQFSGINIVMFYATDVFASAGSTLDPIVCSIILGVVQILATLATTLLVDKLGRKLLLYVSLTGMGVCLFAFGCWYLYLNAGDPSPAVGMLPLFIMNFYLVFFSFGAGPIPWLMIGELFPKHIKGKCGALSGLFNWAAAFFMTFTFQPMTDAMGSAPPFFMYAIVCLLGNVFMYFFVIETKDKALDEIQDELES